MHFDAARTIIDCFICYIRVKLFAQVFQRHLRRSLYVKKMIAYAVTCFTLHSHNIQRADLHIANSRNSSWLPTQIHSVYLKKIKEDILHKIYTEKGTIIGI